VKRLVLAASLVLALLPLLSVAAAPDFGAVGLTPYEPRKPAPAFTLPDLEGRQVSLESLRGKVVLLFYWTTW
jgi:cytochrome oxidase Cu insertion factor (SCO1/SenC/PrrC family)